MNFDWAGRWRTTAGDPPSPPPCLWRGRVRLIATRGVAGAGEDGQTRVLRVAGVGEGALAEYEARPAGGRDGAREAAVVAERDGHSLVRHGTIVQGRAGFAVAERLPAPVDGDGPGPARPCRSNSWLQSMGVPEALRCPCCLTTRKREK